MKKTIYLFLVFIFIFLVSGCDTTNIRKPLDEPITPTIEYFNYYFDEESESQKVETTIKTLSNSLINKEGYEFIGAYNSSNIEVFDNKGKLVEGTIIDSNQKIVGKWEPKIYTFIFNVNDAEFDKKEFKYGSDLGQFKVPAPLEDKDFSGWYLNDVKISDSYGTLLDGKTLLLASAYPVNNDTITLNAKYETRKYSVNINYLGLADDLSIEVLHGDILDFSPVSLENYDYIGLSYDQNYNQMYNKEPIVNNITLFVYMKEYRYVELNIEDVNNTLGDTLKSKFNAKLIKDNKYKITKKMYKGDAYSISNFEQDLKNNNINCSVDGYYENDNYSGSSKISALLFSTEKSYVKLCQNLINYHSNVERILFKDAYALTKNIEDRRNYTLDDVDVIFKSVVPKGFVFKGWSLTAKETKLYDNKEEIELEPGKVKLDLYAQWELDRTLIGKYVTTGTKVKEFDTGTEWTVYNTIKSLPWSLNSKTIVDWSNETQTDVYAQKRNIPSNQGDRYGNLDISSGTSEIYFIGKNDTVFKNFSIHFVSFPNNEFIQIHLINFSYSSNIGTCMTQWRSNEAEYLTKGPIVSLDIVGNCKLIGNTGGNVLGNSNSPLNTLDISGNGNLSIVAGNGSTEKNGGVGIYAIDLTINMPNGKFNCNGGNGGDGHNGQNADTNDMNVKHAGSGANGGSAIVCDNLYIKSNNFTIKAGNGGNGGKGGNSTAGGLAMGTWRDGGNGGNGGNGANAIICSTISINDYSNITGGSGGTGGKGGDPIWSWGSQGVYGANGSNGTNGEKVLKK